MRIISGKFGRRRFQLPTKFNARPTTDFAKENLFNVLNNLIDFDESDALDLFAGTGSISFELLSRGCKSVTSVETNKFHCDFIAKVAEELKTKSLNLVRGDAFQYLKRAKANSFHIIFADPPYQIPDFDKVPITILEKDLLREGGVFIMEHSKERDYSSLPYFSQHRTYGSVNFSLFIKPRSEQGGE